MTNSTSTHTPSRTAISNQRTSSLPRPIRPSWKSQISASRRRCIVWLCFGWVCLLLNIKIEDENYNAFYLYRLCAVHRITSRLKLCCANIRVKGIRSLWIVIAWVWLCIACECRMFASDLFSCSFVILNIKWRKTSTRIDAFCNYCSMLALYARLFNWNLCISRLTR